MFDILYATLTATNEMVNIFASNHAHLLTIVTAGNFV